MSKKMYAIMGSGPLGLWTADALAADASAGNAAAGDVSIRIGNTRGQAPAWLPPQLVVAQKAGRVSWVVLDALDANSVRQLAEGSSALVHCANPAYWEWPEKLPVMQRNAIDAALAAKARLVCADNLYAYAAPLAGPFTEANPENPPSRKGAVRRAMHVLLREAQANHGLQWSTIQASDYFGPGAGAQSTFGDRFLDPVLKGKAPQFLGNPALAHSWAYAPDFGRAMALVATSPDTALLNRSWILPHVGHASATKMAQAFFAELDHQGLLPARHPRTSGALPRFLIRALGLFSPMIREVDEMLYQFLMDFRADGSAFAKATGFAPTSQDEAIRQTVAWWKMNRQA